MVHQKRSQVATWANDTLAEEPKKGKSKPAADYLNFDSDESEELSEEEDGNEPSEDEEETKGSKRNCYPLLVFVSVNVRAGVLVRPKSVSCLQMETVYSGRYGTHSVCCGWMVVFPNLGKCGMCSF